MPRVIFLGTPQFGVPVLQALQQHPDYNVVAVVTQPDRMGGRGRSCIYVPAVKAVALQHELSVFQPKRLRRDLDVIEALRSLQPDVFVLAAFGQILSPKVLAIPRRGTVGVHASLLPKYRGAAPIAAAILNGEPETGITLMETDKGMDTGAIIAQRALQIADTDTTETLSERLACLGAELLLETLLGWLDGTISTTPQDDAQATYAPCLDRSMARIDWTRPALEIDRLVRAMQPWPVAYTTWEGTDLRVHAARAVPAQECAAPGTVVALGKAFGVATGQGVLALDSVQPAGKRAMDGGAFGRGRSAFLGSQLV